MAGDWIKWTKGLASRREVLAIAALVGRDRHEVAGRLMVLWEWCDENIPDEALDDDRNAVIVLSPRRGDNLSTIDSIAGVSGFAEAMEAVGWLSLVEARVVFPHYGRHNGETAKTRARNLKNQNALRSSGGRFGRRVSPLAGDTCHRATVTESRELSPAGEQKTVTRDRDRDREEEEEGNAASPPPRPAENPRNKNPRERPEDVPIPPELRTAEFSRAWFAWVEMRRARRYTLRGDYLRKRLGQLAGLPPGRAVECLEYSTSNEYEGLFPERFRGGQPGRPGGVAGAIEQGLRNVLEGLGSE